MNALRKLTNDVIRFQVGGNSSDLHRVRRARSIRKATAKRKNAVPTSAVATFNRNEPKSVISRAKSFVARIFRRNKV